MTRVKKDSTVVVITFTKGEDIPKVLIKSHLYLDIQKIEVARNIMTKEFFALANSASSQNQRIRRERKIKERERRVNPYQTRLAEAMEGFTEAHDSKLEEITNG